MVNRLRDPRLLILLVMAIGLVVAMRRSSGARHQDSATAPVSGKASVAPRKADSSVGKGGSSRAKIIARWATCPDLTQTGIDPEFVSRLKGLVKAGRFEEAVRFLEGWENELWQQLGAQFVWFKWAEHDRDKARDFIESEPMSVNLKQSAASALFRGMAARTSPEDVQWVRDFLTRNYEPGVLPGVGDVARLWVLTGVISPEDFVGWAKSDGGDRFATWIQALAGAPALGRCESMEGRLAKSDLLEVSSSCLEVARELQPMIEGADQGTSNPKMKLERSVAMLLSYSGVAVAQVLGASDLSAYPAPEDRKLREWYFDGVGRGLDVEAISDVHAVVVAFPDAELAAMVWTRYLNGRIERIADPGPAVAEIAKLNVQGGFRDQMIDVFVDKQFDRGIEPLTHAVETLPPGDARDRYALGIAREWAERGNAPEARRWLNQVQNRALVPADGGD